MMRHSSTMAKVLELVVYNGCLNGDRITPETGDFASFTSFEQILQAYQKQMQYCVSFLTNADNSVDMAHGQRAPLPFLSSMVDDCIGKGAPVQTGGAHYNFTGPQGVGVANVGDSLMCIKELVFDQKKYTLAEIKQAMLDNFGAGTATSAPVSREVLAEVVRRLTANGQTMTEEQIRRLAEIAASGSVAAARKWSGLQCNAGRYGECSEIR